MLSHANLLANVDTLAQIFPMKGGDCFIGVLPFFHSFGFTGTLWFPLLLGAPSRITRIRWTPRRSASSPATTGRRC